MGGCQSDTAMGRLLDVISRKQEGKIFQILIHSKISDSYSVLAHLPRLEIPSPFLEKMPEALPFLHGEKVTAVFWYLRGCAGASLVDAAATGRALGVGKAWFQLSALTRGI